MVSAIAAVAATAVIESARIFAAINKLCALFLKYGTNRLMHDALIVPWFFATHIFHGKETERRHAQEIEWEVYVTENAITGICLICIRLKIAPACLAIDDTVWMVKGTCVISQRAIKQFVAIFLCAQHISEFIHEMIIQFRRCQQSDTFLSF